MVRLLVIEAKHKRAREPIQLPDHDVLGAQVGEEPEELGVVSKNTNVLKTRAPFRIRGV